MKEKQRILATFRIPLDMACQHLRLPDTPANRLWLQNALPWDSHHVGRAQFIRSFERGDLDKLRATLPPDLPPLGNEA